MRSIEPNEADIKFFSASGIHCERLVRRLTDYGFAVSAGTVQLESGSRPSAFAAILMQRKQIIASG